MNTDLTWLPSLSVRRILLCAMAGVILSPCLAADRKQVMAHIVSAAMTQTQPTVTVLPAATGAFLQSYTGGSAVLSLGRAAYYGGATASGVSARKNSGSMTLSTRFALQVDCGGNPLASMAEIAVSLTGLDQSYAVTLDGAKLSLAASPTTLRCGSRTEHVLEVEVPKSAPAGPIAGTISFAATPKF